MTTTRANLLNSLTLILMPLWAYLTFEGTVEKPDQSVTAFIPLFLGVVLLLCSKGIKKENKIIAHVAVLVTLVALLGLTMPLKAAISDGRMLSTIRVVIMISTGIIAMYTFIQSFIRNRKEKNM
tara:strand:+ start:695 stop:1066 length:372 start_codon:yes stop_codon:yes gene_type:complete